MNTLDPEFHFYKPEIVVNRRFSNIRLKINDSHICTVPNYAALRGKMEGMTLKRYPEAECTRLSPGQVDCSN